jgi:hypothetical protein
MMLGIAGNENRWRNVIAWPARDRGYAAADKPARRVFP